MSLSIVLRDEAEAELELAFDYYEAQSPGLGVDFVARVQEVFDRLGKNPLLHAVVLADVRKAKVTQFPFCVYYRAEPNHVHVLSVFHTSRDPSIWQSRI